jgi:hypothetical protein
LPLDPRFAGSNLAEGGGFLRAKKNLQHAFIQRRKAISRMLLRVYGVLKHPSKYERDTS